MTLSEPIKNDAVIYGHFRYCLSRVWDPQKRLVLFIGLNPSTADEKNDDHTVTRCVNFAKSWGYGGILIGNLFAYRATDPRVLKRVGDPIGPENDKWLLKLSAQVEKTVAVWGNHGSYMHRDMHVRSLLKNLNCLGLTKAGQPHHPRGLSATCKMRSYLDEK